MSASAAIPKDSRATRMMLWTLLIVYVFNFLDRQIVNILAEPIRKDLNLSDTQPLPPVGTLRGHMAWLSHSLLLQSALG